jgi:purine/pyrimidine-nucleoside phosphorylase
MQFNNVTVHAKANVYFDGKVTSHNVIFPDGTKKTIGLIFAGKFHFGTNKPEKMEIIAGDCQVKIDGQSEWAKYSEGSAFDVPGKCGFEIEVTEGHCEYVCSFIE